jgi:hypothetical protein
MLKKLMQKLNNAKIKMQKIKDTTYLYGDPPPSLLVAKWWLRGLLGEVSDIIWYMFIYIYIHSFYFIHVYTQQFWNSDKTNHV